MPARSKVFADAGWCRTSTIPNSGSSISLWTTEEALRAYESSDVLKNAISAKLAPFFSGEYETRRCRVRLAEGAPAPDEWLGTGSDC